MVHTDDNVPSKANERARTNPTNENLPVRRNPFMPAMDDRDRQPARQSAAEPAAVPPIYLQQPGLPAPQGQPTAQYGQFSPTQTVNVHVNSPAMPMIIVAAQTGPPLIVRVLWYLFVGWWLSALIIVLGYFFMITVIGIPLAFALFNRIPQALTLRPRTTRYGVQTRDGVTYLGITTVQQRPWYLRAVYFLLIGWWFGAVWLVAAWLIGLLILTLPLSFLMYNRTSGVMTLQRH